MRSALIACIAVIALAACVANAQLLEARYDGSIAATTPDGPVEGQLLGDAVLVEEGLTGGGLQWQLVLRGRCLTESCFPIRAMGISRLLERQRPSMRRTGGSASRLFS